MRNLACFYDPWWSALVIMEESRNNQSKQLPLTTGVDAILSVKSPKSDFLGVLDQGVVGSGAYRQDMTVKTVSRVPCPKEVWLLDQQNLETTYADL